MWRLWKQKVQNCCRVRARAREEGVFHSATSESCPLLRYPITNLGKRRKTARLGQNKKAQREIEFSKVWCSGVRYSIILKSRLVKQKILKEKMSLFCRFFSLSPHILPYTYRGQRKREKNRWIKGVCDKGQGQEKGVKGGRKEARKESEGREGRRRKEAAKNDSCTRNGASASKLAFWCGRARWNEVVPYLGRW